MLFTAEFWSFALIIIMNNITSWSFYLFHVKTRLIDLKELQQWWITKHGRKRKAKQLFQTGRNKRIANRMSQLHTHNRAFPLLQTSYIEEGAITQWYNKDKEREGQWSVKRSHSWSIAVNNRYIFVLDFDLISVYINFRLHEFAKKSRIYLSNR